MDKKDFIQKIMQLGVELEWMLIMLHIKRIELNF